MQIISVPYLFVKWGVTDNAACWMTTTRGLGCKLIPTAVGRGHRPLDLLAPTPCNSLIQSKTRDRDLLLLRLPDPRLRVLPGLTSTATTFLPQTCSPQTNAYSLADIASLSSLGKHSRKDKISRLRLMGSGCSMLVPLRPITKQL